MYSLKQCKTATTRRLFLFKSTQPHFMGAISLNPHINHPSIPYFVSVVSHLKEDFGNLGRKNFILA